MLNPLNPEPSSQTVGFPDGCVLKPIIINVSGVNTHLPAILMFTRATFGFDPKPPMVQVVQVAVLCKVFQKALSGCSGLHVRRFLTLKGR